ncbi:hypothetical protein [Nocardia terpenica]|uniref:Uncharacterized protein n=1 Tax=Nocardia terpenica TaxID=455432 RepID=A0A6G9YZW1_9NOCA|nr:hypothetical protein [Nocardia terpenica]QIS18754.1 hypothetical protein F6W96_11085 [Nocardia terpenica]
MTFKADLEILTKLGATLHNLAEEAGNIKVDNAPDPDAADQLLSARAAGAITKELIFGGLVATAKERLSETGDVMVDVATQFKNQDDNAADALVAAYNSATGAWTVEPTK